MEIQRMLEARNGQMLEPKWRSRYSNKHLILLVGEGDFSFSSCLATTFGAAFNMVATSLDSRDELLKKYGKEAELNTLNLAQRGALVLHGFDACKMATEQRYLLCGFQTPLFHRIIYNFPHAGVLGPMGREDDAHLMKKHKELVRLFFANARHMLFPGGQVHVSLKLGPPYDSWMLEEQAQVGGLRLVERVPFHREHFPGYQIRRVDGLKKLKLGQADTYIFAARNEVPPSSTLNSEPLGMSSTMPAHLKSLKQAICKARASQVTPLQQVVADEVALLDKSKEKKKLGKKKMKTLETSEILVALETLVALEEMNLENVRLIKASVEALAEKLRIFLEEENEEIIDMDMAVTASLSSAVDIEWGSPSSGCTKSLSPETADLLFQVNPGNEVSEKAQDTTKVHDILGPSPQFSEVSAETISTVDKVEEDIKVDCPSSKQESQLVGIQLMDDVVALQRKMKESSSLEENSGLNEESVGGSSTDIDTQFVEGSLEALAEDLGKFLPEERIDIVSNATDIEWGSQSSCCSTKSTIGPFSPETAYDMDLLFQVNPGNEALVTEKEDITESHFAQFAIMEPAPQAKESETIFTADNLVLEEEIKEDSKQKAGSKHNLKQNLGSKQKSKQNSKSKQKSDSEQQKPKKKLKKKSNQKSDSKQAVQEKYIIWSCGGNGHVGILERVKKLSRFKQKMVIRGQFSGDTSFLHFLGQEVSRLESEEASLDPQKKRDCYHKKKFMESCKSTLIELEVASKESPSVLLHWTQEIAYLETLVEKQGGHVSKQKRQRLKTLKNARVAFEKVVETYCFDLDYSCFNFDP